jgi:hypothetical protein
MVLMLKTRDPNGHAPVTSASSTPRAGDICAGPVPANSGLRSAICRVEVHRLKPEKGDNSGRLLLNDRQFCLIGVAALAAGMPIGGRK